MLVENDCALVTGNDLLQAFDRAMLDLLKDQKVLSRPAKCLWVHESDKVLIYTKGDLVFAFNFHPEKSFEGYRIPAEKKGSYQVLLSSDSASYGGFSRVDESVKYKTFADKNGQNGFLCYLPARSAIVFKKK